MKVINHILAISILAGVTFSSHAERYSVELAVLSSPTLASELSSIQNDPHHTTPSLGYPGAIRKLTTDAPTNTTGDNAPNEETLAVNSWQALNDKEFNRALNTLRRKGYQTLWHNRWLQPIQTRVYSEGVLVTGGHQYADHYELEGSVQIFKETYPHLKVDLWFSKFNSDTSSFGIHLPSLPTIIGENFDEQDLNATNDDRESSAFDFTSSFSQPLYSATAISTLQQSRRVNLGQVIYFDSSGIVTIAKISKHVEHATSTPGT